MIHPYGRDTGGRQYVPAPAYDANTTSGMIGVWLSDDEDVDWSISYINGRPYVNGYTITQKQHNHVPKI